MTQLLDERTVVDYVAGREELSGVLDASTATAEEIGDGNLNLVFRVHDAQKRGLVVKQTLPYVRSDHSWKVTEDSIFAEARGLGAASRFAPRNAPRYYGLDSDRRLVVMEDLSSWQVWRSALNRRQATPLAAHDAGRFVADMAYGTSYFGRSEQETQKAVAEAVNPELEQITEDLIFTEPYFEHEHNGWVSGADDAVRALRNDGIRTEVARLKYEFLTRAEALLHGDLHTNSIFVPHDASPSPDASHAKVFDYEFGFYGPVSFDLGILWGNFLLAQGREYALRSHGGPRPAASGGVDDYLDWLLSLFAESWDGFEGEFRRLVSAHVANRTFTPAFVDAWLLHTLRCSAGFAAAEGVRRTIGWAKVADIETLPEAERRDATVAVLAAARELYWAYRDIGRPEDVRGIVSRSLTAGDKEREDAHAE